MRSIFLMVGLLVTLAIVGVVAKKQLTSLPKIEPTAPGQTFSDPSPQAIQQQYKQALDAALQPAKREPDEK